MRLAGQLEIIILVNWDDIISLVVTRVFSIINLLSIRLSRFRCDLEYVLLEIANVWRYIMLIIPHA